MDIYEMLHTGEVLCFTIVWLMVKILDKLG